MKVIISIAAGCFCLTVLLYLHEIVRLQKLAVAEQSLPQVTDCKRVFLLDKQSYDTITTGWGK